MKDDKDIQALIDYWNKLNSTIKTIEKKFPFFISTIISVILGIIGANSLGAFSSNNNLFFLQFIVYLCPLLLVLFSGYILDLFRRVAILRGYMSYIEEKINEHFDGNIYLWNLKYINRYIKDNLPNKIMMYVFLIVLFVFGYIWLTVPGVQDFIKLNLFINCIFFIVLIVLSIIIIYGFSKNDEIRDSSYRFIKSKNSGNVNVCYYSEGKRIIEKSGVGMAISHQTLAMKKNNINYSIDIKKDHNIFHINTIGFMSMYYLRKNKSKGVPVVITAHTTEEDYRNSFILSNKISPFLKKRLITMYSNADYIIAPTNYTKRLILQDYITTVPVEVISNGVDLDLFKCDSELRNEFRKNYKFNLEDKIILSVGLFINRKGILDFIKFAEKLPDYKFIWFGYTSKYIIPREIWKSIKKAPKNVFFPGYVSQTELVSAYNGCDVFIMPSYEETEGIVILEALACKTKVIVRKIDVYEDWLFDGQNCFKAIDNEDFIDKIVKAVDNDYSDIIKKGYDTAMERSIENVGKKLHGIYKKLLEA